MSGDYETHYTPQSLSSDMDNIKVTGGALLLLVSSVVLFAAGLAETTLVTTAGIALAALGLAAGSLLLGTSDSESRPV